MSAARPVRAPRTPGWGLALLRVVVGITWLHEAAWKIPPGFGEADGGGLYDWATRPLEHPVLPAYNAFLEAVVLPNFAAFGWLVLIAEAALGGFLIVGLATRFWAAIGLVQGTAITLSVLNVPGEWSYAYYLLLAAHVALLAGGAGRTFGVDGVLREHWQRPGRARMLRRALVAAS